MQTNELQLYFAAWKIQKGYYLSVPEADLSSYPMHSVLTISLFTLLIVVVHAGPSDVVISIKPSSPPIRSTVIVQSDFFLFPVAQA